MPIERDATICAACDGYMIQTWPGEWACYACDDADDDEQEHEYRERQFEEQSNYYDP